MLARILAVAVALGLGWVVYMIGMVLTVYDGLLSLIFQPFMAALASFISVTTALFIGLFFRVPILFRWWTRTSLWASLLVVASLLILTFGYSAGLTYAGTNPQTGSTVLTLHPAAALGGYFGLLFAVANWPASMRRRRNKARYNTPLERPGANTRVDFESPSAGRSAPGRWADKAGARRQ